MCLRAHTIIGLSLEESKQDEHANSQSNQELQKSQVGICTPKNSFLQSKHSTPKTKQVIITQSFPPRLLASYLTNFSLNVPRGTTYPRLSNP